MKKKYIMLCLGTTGVKPGGGEDPGKNAGNTSSMYFSKEYPQGYAPVKGTWQPAGLWVLQWDSKAEMNRFRKTTAGKNFIDNKIKKAIAVQLVEHKKAKSPKRKAPSKRKSTPARRKAR